MSRRTVFRHFGTSGQLVATSIDEGRKIVANRVSQLPPPGVDAETWLIETAIAMHEMTRELVGRAFWDIYVERPGTPPEVAASLAGISDLRRQLATQITKKTAWSAVGGDGDPPKWVIDAFEDHVSEFATYALDRYSVEEVGRRSGRILWAVLESARAEEQDDGNVAGKP